MKNFLNIKPVYFNKPSKLEAFKYLEKQNLHKNPSARESDNKELQKITAFFKKINPQRTEEEIFTDLIFSLGSHRGLLLHGYQPLQFLRVFVDEADKTRNKIRKTKGGAINFTLADIEKNILEHLM